MTSIYYCIEERFGVDTWLMYGRTVYTTEDEAQEILGEMILAQMNANKLESVNSTKEWRVAPYEPKEAPRVDSSLKDFDVEIVDVEVPKEPEGFTNALELFKKRREKK